MADMCPMAVDLDTNHDNNHSPAGFACSVGSGGSTGIPMLVVHKRKMMQILEDDLQQKEQNNQQGQHSMVEWKPTLMASRSTTTKTRTATVYHIRKCPSTTTT
jgi:hypothetical protein